MGGGLEGGNDLFLERALEEQEEEFDSFEEVDAVARSLRRVALQYLAVVISILLAVPLLSLLSPWWWLKRFWGGMTLNFFTVAIGLHVAMIVMAVLYTRIANRSEDEMLGRPEEMHRWTDV